MKRHVLALIPLPDHTVDALAERYELHYQPQSAGRPELAEIAARQIEAIVTNGSTGSDEALIAALPSLKVISSFGAGYENIDITAAHQRSIQVTHAPGANASTVADHAIGYALALSRGYCSLTAAVKRGAWKSSRSERCTLNGATVGIIGMGRVGQLIARRAAAFDSTIAYFDVAPRPEVQGKFFSDVISLAEQSDFLIAACPGGPSTHHIINYDVLKALGNTGFVINVSRGTVLDSNDLIRALRENLIAGAGLDVLEEEPEVPQGLLEFDQLLLTPHIAGRSPAALVTQKETLLESLEQALGGAVCRLTVPEMKTTHR
jgi:lactate dehydrogenase-like 2-hydroxyacid dehydrogenase